MKKNKDDGRLLVFKGVDSALARDFKTYCARREKTQREVFIEAIANLIPESERSAVYSFLQAEDDDDEMAGK